MNAGQSISNELLAEVALFRPNKSIESLDLAPPQPFCHFRVDGERFGQSGVDELFGVFSDLDDLRHADAEILGLLNQASRTNALNLGSVDEIEADEIFGVVSANMKTVAVISGIGDELTIFERDPFLAALSASEEVDGEKAEEKDCYKSYKVAKATKARASDFSTKGRAIGANRPYLALATGVSRRYLGKVH